MKQEPIRQHRLFPALRGAMGDWVYYVTMLTFQDVSDWVDGVPPHHQSKRLREWIQRELTKSHAKKITKYLETQEQRMFNALFIAVYGGQPVWAPLKVGSSMGDERFQFSPETQLEIERSIGLLHLSGHEELFAVDGQHRVTGIKQALKSTPSLASEEVAAIFVGHRKDPEGLERTRRLFTTLNKTSKRVNQKEIIALDEDDGAAVVTRRAVDELPMFRDSELLSMGGSAHIGARDGRAVTTLVSLYEQIRDLIPACCTIGSTAFTRERPDEVHINALLTGITTFWTLLFDKVPELQAVRNGTATAKDFRLPGHNHMLFRPVGQRALAAATAYACSRDANATIEGVLEKLLETSVLWLDDQRWHFLLWNPVTETIQSAAKYRKLAMIQLLQMADFRLSSQLERAYSAFSHDREAKLQELQ